MVKFIGSKYATKLIKESHGTIFAVTFTKANGLTRVLNGRLHVTKGVKGTGKSPISPNALRVYDFQVNAWRTVSLDTVTALNIKGKCYRVA